MLKASAGWLIACFSAWSISPMEVVPAGTKIGRSRAVIASLVCPPGRPRPGLRTIRYGRRPHRARAQTKWLFGRPCRRPTASLTPAWPAKSRSAPICPGPASARARVADSSQRGKIFPVRSPIASTHGRYAARPLAGRKVRRGRALRSALSMNVAPSSSVRADRVRSLRPGFHAIGARFGTFPHLPGIWLHDDPSGLELFSPVALS